MNIADHFKPVGDEYMLSPAAVLVLTSDAVNGQDSGKEGKERARRVIEEVIAAGRAAKYEKADILETMLLRGAQASRLLPMCDELVKRVGNEGFLDALRRAGFNPTGDSQ